MSAGASLSLFKNFVIIGVLCLIFGKVFDLLVQNTNYFNMAGDALNTLSFFSLMLKAFPFIYLIVLLLNHLVESNNESSRGV
jgi:uncharacterized membrane protein